MLDRILPLINMMTTSNDYDMLNVAFANSDLHLKISYYLIRSHLLIFTWMSKTSWIKFDQASEQNCDFETTQSVTQRFIITRKILSWATTSSVQVHQACNKELDRFCVGFKDSKG